MDAAFGMIKDALAAGHLVNVGTDGANDEDTNDCGVATGHAYSVHAAFYVEPADGGSFDLVMVRNPWGTAGYNLEWSNTDERWTDELVAELPVDFDPRTSMTEYGIMFVPKENLNKCFDDVSMAYIYSGYSDNWYDALDMDENFNTYFFVAPEKNGDIFVTVETYSDNIVPLSCTANEDLGTSSPLVTIVIYKANDTDEEFTRIAAHQYEDIMHIPIRINSTAYDAEDIFAIDVQYAW